MAGSGGNAVVATNADLSEALEGGALGNRSTQTDHAALIGVDSTNLTGTGATVQAVLEELDTVADTATDHIADTSAAHAASAISVNSATLTGVGTDLQAVLEELDNTADLAAVEATAALYRPLFSHLTADSAARNATTTLLASGLTVTVAAGTYELDALVMYITAAAADISFKWGGTATVTATVGTSDIVAFPGALAGGDGSTPGLGVLLPTSWTTETETPFANTAAHTATPVYFKGVLVVTVAGTIILEFTQGTSDASDTKIKAGSWLKLQKVA